MNHTLKTIFTGLVMVALVNSTQTIRAQGKDNPAPLKITIADAISMALKNSKQVKVNLAKIDEAKADLQVAKDRKLPDVTISGSYLRLNNPNINLAKSSSSSSSGSSSGGGVDVSQAVYGLANVSYPIYSGLRIRNGITASEYLEKAVELDADNDKEGIALNVISAYISLYKSRAAVDLVNENLKQSKQRDSDFSNLEKNGLLARNDLLKANLQTSNFELSLLDAESNAKLANVGLALLLGVPEQTEIQIDSTSLQFPQEVKVLSDYEQMAFDNRKDVQALTYRGKAAATGIQAVKGEMYPSVALGGGYVAADIPGFLSITNAVNVSVGVQYSLSSLWKTKAKIQQVTAKQQQLMASQEGLTDNIRYQVNQAYQGWLLSNKKIEVYAKAIDQATENYRITKNKYNNSLATTTDLLDADVAQLQAKLNYSFAKSDAIVAYNKLMEVTGMINTK
ncbi:TolC family protein [Parasediminibacterium sp. JCM 36343]|uniref:TolC family protein n=1 Tax=Parasediminibacterium sp. JCM 36343 TaxID=3374279 RepID=UPI0039788C74